MKQNLTSEEIRTTILERYEIDELTLEKNMIDFYAMLRHFNLVEE